MATIQSHQAVLVLADIGGYTRFIKFHDMALVHAEKIITELLESVIQAAEYPLTLNKLEGDAAFFFALADRDSAGVVRSALAQVAAFFPAFASKRAELEAAALCTCSACQGVDQLRIKAIVHFGEVAVKQVRQFEELAGSSVIIAHRLLKNSVKKDQYVLVTEAANQLGGSFPGQQGVSALEHCEGIGDVRTVVYDPPSGPPIAPPRVPLLKKLLMLSKLMGYDWTKRLGFHRGREFPSLAGV